MEGWLRDLAQAGRSLARDARVAVFVTLTLALGIGPAAAMFGIGDRLFGRGPEHVVDHESLVRLYLQMPEDGPGGGRTAPHIPYLTAEAIREGTPAFAGAALYRYSDELLRGDGAYRPARVATVGPGFFSLLGPTPVLGRFFDEPAGAASTSVVVAHRWWQTDLGGDPAALGRSVLVDGEPRTVVGVAPPGFSGPELEAVDAWLPLDPDAARSRNWHVVARLGGSTGTPRDPAAAQAAADAVHRRTDPGRFFGWARNARVVLAPISADDSGRTPVEADVARLLAGVTVLLLALAVANVISLTMARQTRRRRELAVRLALGIGRGRLARLLLSETVLLAGLAGLASLPVAWLTGTLVRRILLPDIAWSSAVLSGRTLAVTVGIAVVAGIAVGVAPLARAARAEVIHGLRRGAGGGRAGTERAHLALATLQVALSATLLLAAGLFVRSFVGLRATDLGIDAAGVTVITFRPSEPGALPTSAEGQRELHLAALEIAETDAAVDAAAVSLGVPFLYNFGRSIAVPGRDSIPELPGGGPYLSGVTAGYFDAVGTPVLEGRAFTEAEVAGEAAVIVVSASMARTLWPGEGALGRCVRLGTGADPCSTVIGVVGDVHRRGYREPPSMQYYIPYPSRSSFGGSALVVRIPPGRDGGLARLRERLRGVHPGIGYVEAVRLESLLDEEARPWRLGAWVLGPTAALALLVAVLGVYGVLSYLVEQRRGEMGVRIALGASRARIRRLVAARGIRAGAGGLAVGFGAALLAGRWLDPLLFETTVREPAVMGAVAAVLLATAVAASLLPAERAARVAPVDCLRED